MTDQDKLPLNPSIPLNGVWNGLLSGDPGPFVALFDSLMDSDLPFGAGGVLRDLSDRIVSASEEIDDADQRQQFVDAARQAILVCLNEDQAQLDALLQEAANA